MGTRDAKTLATILVKLQKSRKAEKQKSRKAEKKGTHILSFSFQVSIFFANRHPILEQNHMRIVVYDLIYIETEI